MCKRKFKSVHEYPCRSSSFSLSFSRWFRSSSHSSPPHLMSTFVLSKKYKILSYLSIIMDIYWNNIYFYESRCRWIIQEIILPIFSLLPSWREDHHLRRNDITHPRAMDLDLKDFILRSVSLCSICRFALRFYLKRYF